MTQGVIHSNQEVSHMAETRTRRRRYFRMLEKRLEEAGGEMMKAWRAQARRHDRVGDLSYRGLEILHGGAEAAWPPRSGSANAPRPDETQVSAS